MPKENIPKLKKEEKLSVVKNTDESAKKKADGNSKTEDTPAHDYGNTIPNLKTSESIMPESDIISRLENQLRQNEEVMERVYKTSERVRKYLFWVNVLNVLRIIFIIVPIALTILYLPAIINNIMGGLGIEGGISLLKDISPQGMIEEYKNILE